MVLDVKLPDLSGFEVCRRIKENAATAHMLVLHLSASSVGLDSRLQGLGSGGDSYLTEPVEPEELVANVGALLRREPPSMRCDRRMERWPPSSRRPRWR